MKDWSRLGLAASLVVTVLFSHVSVASAQLWADTRYERPSSGYEGTYEWRGVMANTYVYNWYLTTVGQYGPGEHVSSVYIHHPRYPGSDGYRFMEAGIWRLSVNAPWAYCAWNTSATDPLAYQDVNYHTVSNGQTWKLVIRNMTMGDVNTGWQRWIMSFDDVIYWDQTHPLTYGQAWTSAECYRGPNPTQGVHPDYQYDHNTAYFSGMKKTSRPANWKYWTANTARLNQDPLYKFSGVASTSWYNLHN